MNTLGLTLLGVHPFQKIRTQSVQINQLKLYRHKHTSQVNTTTLNIKWRVL